MGLLSGKPCEVRSWGRSERLGEFLPPGLFEGLDDGQTVGAAAALELVEPVEVSEALVELAGSRAATSALASLRALAADSPAAAALGSATGPRLGSLSRPLRPSPGSSAADHAAARSAK